MVPLLHGDHRPGIQPHRDSVLALASPPAEKTEVIQLKLLNVSLPAPPRLSFLCASFSLFCLREHACFCSLHSLQQHHSPSPAAPRAPGLELSFLSPASSTHQPSSSRSPSPCCLLLRVLMPVVFLVQNVCGLGLGVRLGPGSCLCPLPIWWAVDKPPFLPASVSSSIN